MAQTLAPTLAVVQAMENELRSDPAQFQSDYAKRDVENLAATCEEVARRLRNMLATCH